MYWGTGLNRRRWRRVARERPWPRPLCPSASETSSQTGWAAWDAARSMKARSPFAPVSRPALGREHALEVKPCWVIVSIVAGRRDSRSRMSSRASHSPTCARVFGVLHLLANRRAAPGRRAELAKRWTAVDWPGRAREDRRPRSSPVLAAAGPARWRSEPERQVTVDVRSVIPPLGGPGGESGAQDRGASAAPFFPPPPAPTAGS